MSTKPAELPIFKMYSLGDLEKKVKGMYTPGYLLAVRAGNKPLNRRFRTRMTELLKRSESELFGEAA